MSTATTATISTPAVSTPPTLRINTSTGPRTHLTRRGRVVLLAVLVGLLLAAFTVGRGDTSRAATEGSAASGYSATTVHAGETLWAVAQRVHPGHDPRALVQRLREINHLQTASVQVGQQLLVPALG